MRKWSKNPVASPAISARSLVLGQLQQQLSTFTDQQLTDAELEQVSVNGVTVPIVRLPGHDLLPFFEQLFASANLAFFADALPSCSINWNKRLRSAGGRVFVHKRAIELSAIHYESAGAAALGVVLVHEQIHQYLFESGQRFGHTPAFREISLRLGLPELTHRMPLPDRLARRAKYLIYQCPVCNQILRRKRAAKKAIACLRCCRLHNRGHYDARFRFKLVGTQMGVEAESA